MEIVCWSRTVDDDPVGVIELTHRKVLRQFLTRKWENDEFIQNLFTTCSSNSELFIWNLSIGEFIWVLKSHGVYVLLDPSLIIFCSFQVLGNWSFSEHKKLSRAEIQWHEQTYSKRICNMSLTNTTCKCSPSWLLVLIMIIISCL